MQRANSGKTHFNIPIFAGILAAAGAGLFIWIISHSNPRAIFGLIAAGRWRLCVVVMYHAVPLFLDAVAWRCLFAGRRKPRLLQLYWMRWIGESVSNMLPSLQVGGDLLRARLVVIHGAARTPAAAASVLVDITLSILTQTLFTVAGLSLLLYVSRAFSAGRIVAGAIATLLALGGFYAVQRRGLFRLMGLLASKLAGGKEWRSLVANGKALDDATRSLYRRPDLLSASGGATLASWIIGSGEVLLSLWMLHYPAKLTTALIFESVGQAIEAGMFFIPGALGVQEGAYLGLGKLLGLPTEVAVTMALIRRARELSFGIPGVVTWQLIETRRVWRLRKRAKRAASA